MNLSTIPKRAAVENVPCRKLPELPACDFSTVRKLEAYDIYLMSGLTAVVAITSEETYYRWEPAVSGRIND
ncbi:MAG: hypothetical protein ACI9G1_001161 [Pirellulaceae bacterium]|jgi:hypothetical protein